jgi:hypothetical protein
MNIQVHNRHVSSQTTAPKKLEDSEFPDTFNGCEVTCSEGGTNQRVEVLKSIPRKERSPIAARKPPRPPRSEAKAKWYGGLLSFRTFRPLDKHRDFILK